MRGIAYWVEKWALLTPSRLALVGEQGQLSYREVNQQLEAYGATLQLVFGVREGDRIGILSHNNLEYIILLLAIARLNAIAVPLNVRLTKDELEYQVNDSGLRLLVTDDALHEKGKYLKGRTMIETVLQLERLKVIGEDAEMKDVAVVAGAPFIICYTSGTTGRPKGAVLTQENMFWNVMNNITAIDLTSRDTSIVLLPLFHIGGIGLFTLPTLFVGGTVVVPRKFEAEQTLEMIEKHRVSIVMGVPTIHDALRKGKNFETVNLDSVRWFYSGGAPCPEELIRFYIGRGLRFGQGFGMTETSPTVFMLMEEDYKRKIGSIGKPAMFNDIRVVDGEGLDVVVGQTGELLIKGPNVFKEYWNLPEATAESFRNGGWFATGDLVTQDEEGFVYIAGRKKEMIISGGENIYPLEVEKVLYELQEVQEAAVIGIPHEKWGETVMAVVAVNGSNSNTVIDEIKHHCLKRLARYKAPSKIKLVSALPKNATGKIDKGALKKQYSVLGKGEVVH